MTRLVLFDGNAILHRAFHALPPSLTAKDGTPTNAVYGFVAMLLKVIEDLKPTHVAVAFDRPKPTFRKELFKDYQAQRPEMDDKLVPQIAFVHDVLSAMKIPVFEMDGYEADDVLGTITQQVQSSKFKVQSGKVDDVVIVTGDRDLLQLVNEKVKLYMPVKGLIEAKLFGEKEAEERMGVTPRQVPDFKALAGDPSDNYPGVAGIGPKTAVQLLKQFGSVENLYQHLDRVKNPAVKEKLIKDKANALLSHKLATVVTDVPVDFSPETTELPSDFLTQEVITAFGKLGFKTLLKRLTEMGKKEPSESINKAEAKKDLEKSQMELF